MPPPKPERPRGRGLTEREKERALRALRALVADPATDFAALGGDELSAALRCAREEGSDSTGLIVEVMSRIGAGSAFPRDLHQVLFPAVVHSAGRGAWASARAAAMAAIAAQPHLAVEVLGLESQRPGTSGMRVAESADTGGFTATAVMERRGELIEGRRCAAGSKKRARQEAALSLLAAVTGLPVPPAPGIVPPVAAAPADRPPGASVPEPPASRMSAADLEAWLDYEVTQPGPDGDLARAVQAGPLSVRALYLLLFEASPGGWAAQRAIAWDALRRCPVAAPGVLSLRTQARGLPPVSYLEPDADTAVAFLVTPDGPVVGEHAVAATQKAARAAAALTLIRDLVEPAGQAPVPAVSHGSDNPVGILNERAQTGVITGLGYETGGSGPAHQPVFTCTVSCRYATRDYACTAEGRSKNEAKTAAVAGLLDQITAAERSVVTRLAHTRHDQARSIPGIFGRLLRAGCAVEFAVRGGFRLGDGLPAPLGGWSLPLVLALPVLAAPDGGTDADDGAVLHPSAREWAAAARAALEAVADRRVYPAADDEGRDCWRIEADVRVPQDFLDAVAGALLRPPGGRLVIGDLPYVGRPRRLSSDETDWADRVAAAVEGTQPAPIAFRISPPRAAGESLRAELHAVRLGHAEYQLLRRAARDWPALSRVVADGTLSGTDAAQLLGDAGERLAAHAITVEWPADLVASPENGTGGGGLRRSAVVRARADDGGTFSVADGAELTWRLELDGVTLSADEVAAVDAAVEGVLRLRGRWVVIGPQARQQGAAGRLTGPQALAAALTGQVTVDGTAMTCTAAGRLADLVDTLRGSSEDPVAADDDLAIDGLEATLRGYQRQGVGWLRRLAGLGFGALLADDMGLGKTLTIIAFWLSRRGDGPALVVCPASLLANWEREFARFAPGVAVRRYHAAGRSLDAFGAGEVVVTTYGTLLRDAERLAGVAWDLVVADEAQQVKNHRSQAARSLRLLRPVMRVAVTGTPVENSLSELWAILDWVNPGLFGSSAAFRERYGRAAERTVGPGDDEAAADAARRLGRLIAPFMLRRRKTDPGIVPELPEKVVSDRYVQLTGEQAALYQAAVGRLLAGVTASAGIERRGQVLRLLQSLRQICNSPAHFLREPIEGWDADAQAARSGKLATLEELLESVTAAGEAALIFTSYVSMGHLIQAHLAARGITAGFLHGAVPVGRRQQVVDAFQAGDGDALVLSVRAAGTGLTLTRAGHVIHFDRPWNPAVEDQATDRAHRIGASRLVEVHHLITEGTVEDRIADLLARKRGLADAVLSGGETRLADLSDGELRALVSLGRDRGDA